MRLWAHAAGGIVVAQQLAVPQRTAQAPAGTLLGPMVTRAIDTLKAQVIRHPSRADGHYHLAMCQHAAGQLDEAWQSVSRSLEINPRYITAAKLYAQLEVVRRPAVAA
jgi:hypothetical protein